MTDRQISHTVVRGPKTGLQGSGPAELVEVETTQGMVTITFKGAANWDLLFAAATWLREHPDAVLYGINYVSQNLCPNDLCDPPQGSTPLERLELTVDLGQPGETKTSRVYVPGLP